MTVPAASFCMKVDLLNPGEFFACCGIFELADRLWPGAEAWFADEPDGFCVMLGPGQHLRPVEQLCDDLARCSLGVLMEEGERSELAALSGIPKKNRTQEQQDRLGQLQSRERVAPILLGDPFQLRLDWWNDEEDAGALKTWAGQQSAFVIARSMQDALRDADRRGCRLLQYACTTSNEPFYFDARRAWTALDAGFSADALDLSIETRPAVELLALVGLQRFRPVREGSQFSYSTWGKPCPPSVARAAACGAISLGRRRTYQFSLYNRDRRGRYKGFSYAQEKGGMHE